MCKQYKLTFTQDRKNYTSRIIPAESLVDAYLIIQDKFPGAEITGTSEYTIVSEDWAHVVAKHMITHATFDELCKFGGSLDEQKREEFATAIWDVWHKMPVKVV